jgi:5-methylcytosine-specific restriction endonuclease McrA
MRAYSAANTTRIAQYRADNAERRNEQGKTWRAANAWHVKEHRKQFYIENAERINKAKKITREKTVKQRSASKKVWDAANIEHRKQYNKAWRAANAQHIKGYFATSERWKQSSKHSSRRRRAIKNNIEGSHTQVEWRAIVKQFKGRCVCCGEYFGSKLTLDHVIPISRGGTDYISNIQCLCKQCNSSKRDWHSTDYRKTPFARAGQQRMFD